MEKGEQRSYFGEVRGLLRTLVLLTAAHPNMSEIVNQTMFERLTTGTVSRVITGVGSVVVLLSLGSFVYASVRSTAFPAAIGFLAMGLMFLFWGLSDLVPLERRRTILALRLVALGCSACLTMSVLQRIVTDLV
jgi:hypothetical protein